MGEDNALRPPPVTDAQTAATNMDYDWSDHYWRRSTPVTRVKKTNRWMDDDGNAVTCIRRSNGRMDCTDDNNRRRYCRLNQGYMTCSDNDNRWDWDAAEETNFESFIQEMSAEFMI